MRTAAVWVVSSFVAAIACKSGGGSADDKEPPAAAPAGETPAGPPVEAAPPPAEPPAPAGPAKVTAEVVETDGPPSLRVRVEVGGKQHELVLTSKFDYCESTEAHVDEVDELGDDRLRMVQLFCEQGEDFFQRSMITALMLAGPDPKVLWQGEGHYANSMGECDDVDVLHFRPGANGKIEAVRTTGCDDKTEKQEVVATIDVP